MKDLTYYYRIIPKDMLKKRVAKHKANRSVGLYTPVDWRKIRQGILSRDNYACRICTQDWSLEVHHIDYNRRNNQSTNLVTLCDTCHRAVHREGYKPSENIGHPVPWGDVE